MSLSFKNLGHAIASGAKNFEKYAQEALGFLHVIQGAQPAVELVVKAVAPQAAKFGDLAFHILGDGSTRCGKSRSSRQFRRFCRPVFRSEPSAGSGNGCSRQGSCRGHQGGSTGPRRRDSRSLIRVEPSKGGSNPPVFSFAGASPCRYILPILIPFSSPWSIPAERTPTLL
jgi:hypothetical protein